MVTLKLSLFVLSVTIATAWTKSYQFKYDIDRGFNVSLNNVMLLHHTTDSPMVFVGLGQLAFREFRGNFFTNNYIEDRIGLSDFIVVQTTADKDVIQMSFGNQTTLTVTLQSTSDHPLVVSFGAVKPAVYNDMWVRVVATADEKVYGLGEQYSYLNLRGRNYPIWTREQGVGRNKSDIVTFFADNLAGGAGGDYHTTYFPQPTLVSSRNYYCHYKGSNYVEFNLQPSTFHEIYISGSANDLCFNTDTTLENVVGQLTTFLGKQPELPEWVYTGAILGVQGGTKIMMDRLKAAQGNGVPVSGMWIQDWAGILKTSFGSRLNWDWKWNQTVYPNLDKLIPALKANGTRVLAYINPNLNINGDMFKEGAPLGYFVKNSSGQPFIIDFGEFYCGTVDFTNPAAFNWYKQKIQVNMIDLGLSGWMADFGEYLPITGTYFYNNKTGQELHNQWPVLWARCNREAVDERNKTGDVVFWMRSGAAGTGKYTTLMWAGDQNVDFSYGDGLPSTIPAALNMGMSGVGITHFDIGGYTTAAQFASVGRALVRSKELFLRSAEAAIFTPMFRSHEGNQPQANVQFYSSDYIEQSFGRLASIFVHLSNYTKNVVRDNHLFGTPAQRPLFMEFTTDSIATSITYQYMYGSDLLVAPVIATNVTTMKVYLPSSAEWSFIWDNAKRSGGQFVTVPSPLGKPPAFYKSNSVYATLFSQIQTLFPPIPKPIKFSTQYSSTVSVNGCSGRLPFSFGNTVALAMCLIAYCKL